VKNAKDRYQICPASIVTAVEMAAKSLGVLRERRPGQPGRPPVEFRKVMNSIWFRLRTGVQWKAIPDSKYLCNGTTAHRWFMRLAKSGAFELACYSLLASHPKEGANIFRYLGMDGTTSPALPGAQETGENSADRGEPRVKTGAVADVEGHPSEVCVAPAD